MANRRSERKDMETSQGAWQLLVVKMGKVLDGCWYGGPDVFRKSEPPFRRQLNGFAVPAAVKQSC
jgi:hypothetical protein